MVLSTVPGMWQELSKLPGASSLPAGVVVHHGLCEQYAATLGRGGKGRHDFQCQLWVSEE